MMREEDRYKDIKEFNFSEMRIKVFIPDLTEEERLERMRIIHKRTADLIRPATT